MADDPVKTDTWHQEPYFKPSHYGDGEHAFLIVETMDGPDLPVLNGGFIGFDFEDGVTAEEQLELIQMMQRRLKFMTYTGPARPEWADQPGCGAQAEMRRRKQG